VLTDIQVEDFQSLRKLSLRLGRFTVITGATGSGKSSVLRAVELLALNARGTGYIRRGAKSCTVASGDAEQGWSAGIHRYASRGKDCYRLAHQPASGDEPHVEEWTKLGGEVPAEIRSALQLSELNFARQLPFVPFLLDSSGGEVARVLGKLTNVTLLFDAAREAERRRREILGDLNRAEARLADLTGQAQRFAGMRQRREAVSEAESALERAQAISARIGRLRVLTGKLEAAEAALARAVPPEVPDGARLAELAARTARLRALAAAFESGKAAAEDACARSMAAVQDEEAAHGRLHEVLAAAGRCPTCGQEVA
jgi:DNA repair ATPase RecN